MTLWILDTDHISLLQRGHPAVEQRIRSINLNDIAITIISVSVSAVWFAPSGAAFAIALFST